MALVSPGVQVTVIDESFYTPAEPGTTPLIVVATGQDKSNAAGTGTAVGTTAANAGKAFRITSQRELVETFGVPFFEKTATGNPVHGGERNEYGMLALYSYLGSSNNAFVVRANVNLNQLEGRSTIPGSEPKPNRWWVNTVATSFGVQEWNSATLATGGQKFTAKTPIVLTNNDPGKIESGTGILSSESYNRPRGSVGSIGDYAVVFETGSPIKEFARLFYKSAGLAGAGIAAGEWVVVGSPEWTASHPVLTGSTVNSLLTVGETFQINGTPITVPSGANVTAQLTALAGVINGTVAGVYASVANSKVSLHSDGATEVTGDSTLSGRIVITNTNADTALTELGIALGTYLQPKLQHSPHTRVPLYRRTDSPSTAVGFPSGSVWIKTTSPGAGSDWIVNRWNAASKSWDNFKAPLFGTGHAALFFLDRSGGGVNIPRGEVFVQTNAQEHFSFMPPDDTSNTSGLDTSFETVEWRVWVRRSTGNTVVTSKIIGAGTLSGAKRFTIKESLQGSVELSSAVEIVFTANGNADDANLIAGRINAANLRHVQAAVTATNELQLIHKTGGEIRLSDTLSSPIGDLFAAFNVFTLAGTAGFLAAPAGSVDEFIVSNWTPLAVTGFVASSNEPLEEPLDGQLWYNPEVSDIDILVHNGATFVGYKNSIADSDPLGPQVSASAPETQSDGTALVTGDLWISTANIETFPTIYKWDGNELEWYLVDKTDQITEDGILFGDARWRDDSNNSAALLSAGAPDSIVSLLESNFLDFDAPDPALFPKGMLLWNTRRSSGNVKRYVNNYINPNDRNVRFSTSAEQDAAGGQPMTNYAADRWLTASPNNEDGSGSFLRHAQRSVVTAGIKSVIDTSAEIRDEERRNFNLIACPGYPEVIQNLINLNIDRGITAFIIGDTPLRLAPNSTILLNWATNAAGVTGTGDNGITAFDEFMAIYYPNGFTNDLSGANAVVPASHMMLKTIALSDQVSFPWFAPAGTRRGGIVNATSVGYINALSGEFETVQLNEGQRDLLYDQKINPIPFFVGVGHVAFGQKTRGRNASALDRINVARLVVYLRSQLNKLARPYLFEPNDKITRDEIRGATESLLLELVGLRALFDFAVVCDESNNTPSRIDRNELYVDIAIEPVKAVEFIYIPLRLKNTGEI